MKVKKCSILMF